MDIEHFMCVCVCNSMLNVFNDLGGGGGGDKIFFCIKKRGEKKKR